MFTWSSVRRTQKKLEEKEKEDYLVLVEVEQYKEKPEEEEDYLVLVEVEQYKEKPEEEEEDVYLVLGRRRHRKTRRRGRR